MDGVKINGIEKSFRGQKVLENLSFFIPGGSIFFLLGLNGAGKTTLMKIICGLIKPDSGNIEFIPQEIRTGSLIETPVFYRSLSAYENLRHRALISGYPKEEIYRVLDLTGLDPDNKKPVKTYSLGMRQRLGIAGALMGGEKLIILDEPLNGLDPAGMQGIKNLILDINRKEKTTFIISSHLIRESEGLATDYAIISQKRCREVFPADNLNSLYKKYGLDPGSGSVEKLFFSAIE